ncbi:hypothetical protein ACT3SZ_11215 [Corynebacterium sp. AOP40-9SA-29]|uniref:hypothetical protein n=1 Tax=Corynebacterium sp. AOP40-9SA-29 TaxID=3457677 RepID=UPI0040344FE8
MNFKQRRRISAEGVIQIAKGRSIDPIVALCDTGYVDEVEKRRELPYLSNYKTGDLTEELVRRLPPSVGPVVRATLEAAAVQM